MLEPGSQAAPGVDRRGGGARGLRRRLGGQHAQPLRACARRSPSTRTSTRGSRSRSQAPRGEGAAAPLPAAVAAGQQADPRRALDPRQRRPAATSSRAARRAPTSSTARTRWRTASARAASPSTRSAARSSSRRSSTSATTRATRFRSPASGASTRAATTRSMPTAEELAQLGRRAGGARPRPRLGALGAALGRARGRARRRPRAAPVGHPAGAALRLQHRRGRPLRAARGRDVRARARSNPHYFANPPAFTYLLHFLFAVCLRRRERRRARVRAAPRRGVHARARRRRACSARAALWLLYVTGARLFGRAVGLLAAAIEAVAFLPVFYAHLALNDVPTLAPLTLSLLGTAGVLRKGRARDYLLAGVGLGLACATKYTAGIVLVPLLAAVVARYLERGRGPRAAGRRALGGLAARGRLALLAFLIANPYSLLDYSALPRRTRPPVDALRPKPRASSARPRRAASSTTCGRSPGASAGCRRWPRSAARCTVWRARTQRSGWLLVPGVAAVPRVHGPAGALLRALADADLPDPVPAGGVLRVQLARGAGALEPASAAARALRRRRSPAAARRGAARAGRSSTASTRAWCSRARTRAT